MHNIGQVVLSFSTLVFSLTALWELHEANVEVLVDFKSLFLWEEPDFNILQLLVLCDSEKSYVLWGQRSVGSLLEKTSEEGREAQLIVTQSAPV